MECLRFMPHFLFSSFGRARRRQPLGAHPLIYLHIPKTAGSSLAEGFQAAIHPHQVVRGFDSVVFGDFDAFSTLSPEIRAHVYNGLPLPPSADFVAGHFAYPHLKRVYPDGAFFTVLREPICRLLSLWLFWRSHDTQVLAPWGAWADRVRLAWGSLGDFLRAPEVYCQIDNVVLRMLLSPHPLIPVNAPISERHDATLLRQARSVLMRFGFTDIVENPNLAARISRWLERDFRLPKQNETPAMPVERQGNLALELDREALALLESHTRLDRILWRELVRERMPALAPEQWERQILLRQSSRFSLLLRASA